MEPRAGLATYAGYQPEVTYFESLHELKPIVDPMYQGRHRQAALVGTDTAEYGDYVSGPRVIRSEVKTNIQAVEGAATRGGDAGRTDVQG
ncbi:MAG: hypothetical protein ABI890_13960, partial [Lapillicoccus sp.]